MNDARAYWEGALKKYGTQNWIDKPTIFIEQVVQFFPRSGRVLELAAGQGQDARYLAKLGFRVLCTDQSDYGLQEAKRKAERENLSIAFQKIDLSKPLPFASNEFDVVYSHLGLHYFDKQTTLFLFSEIRRILKPSGILAALFNTVDDPEIRSNEFEKIEDDYYHEISTGLFKRYFSIATTKKLINGLFEPIIVDQEGSAYKDGKKRLVRLVARVVK